MKSFKIDKLYRLYSEPIEYKSEYFFSSVNREHLVLSEFGDAVTISINDIRTMGFELVTIPDKLRVFSVDTDAITVCKTSGEAFSDTEQSKLIDDLNSMYPDLISWELDGSYPAILVVKTKNYALKLPDGKIKIHGSGLKASMKEKALKQFIKEVISLLLADDHDGIYKLYDSYVQRIMNLQDISDWCSKKTITASVLDPQRTNEQKILAAIENDNYQEGDRIHVYFKTDGSLGQSKNWKNDHCPYKLLEKLHKSILIFSAVLDKKKFVNYSLKTKRKLLET